MSNRERRKGAEGEREVVRLAAVAFPDAGIQRAAGGARQLGADLVRIPGAVVDVKRHEQLRLPLWIREHDPLGAQLGLVPVIAYRTNAQGVVPGWRADMPLADAFALLADSAELVRVRGYLGDALAYADGAPADSVERWRQAAK